MSMKMMKRHQTEWRLRRGMTNRMTMMNDNDSGAEDGFETGGMG